MPAPAAKLVGIAHRNAQRLGDLVNDILEVERLSSGRLTFDLAEIDLDQVIREALDTHEAYAQAHGVRFVHVPPPAAVRARGDAHRLQQVLANLLSNAAKVSPQGTEVEVTLKGSGAAAIIEIADHGPGIPEEFKDRVFERFARANDAENRKRGGTGLGLHIAKVIVERHQGSIGFRTRPGGGTIFWFSLPRVAAAAASLA